MKPAAAKVSLMPRPLSEKSRRGLVTRVYTTPCPKGNSISHATTRYMFMYIFGQSVCSCMACVIDRLADTNYVSSL